MARACNTVSATLTAASLFSLVGEVADGTSPASAPGLWLRGTRLTGDGIVTGSGSDDVRPGRDGQAGA